MLPKDVYVVSGPLPGPTLAVFAGVHGNELAGVYALRALLPALKLTSGTVYFVYANPPAIKANVRMLQKNFNRCFYKGNMGTSYEDTRARELMGILDKCDALLDLHMFYDEAGLPFAICEDNALDIANKFNVEIVSTNWTAVELGGTDGYMYNTGKIGICVECGPLSKSVQRTGFAIEVIQQFLSHFKMVGGDAASYANKPKRLIRAKHAVYKSSKDFVLAAGFKNFDPLKNGQVIGKDPSKTYKANKNECIVFPHYNARVGEEAYIVGEEISGRLL